MRAAAFPLIAALALAACGGNAADQNAAVVDDVLNSADLSGNDLTTIDAAFAADANMAADVDIDAVALNGDDDADGGRSGGNRPARRTPSEEGGTSSAEPAEADETAAEPAEPAANSQ